MVARKRKQLLIVCCGVGVDSVAMLVEMHNRGIRPDLILFSDTGGEKPETYAYIPILRDWLLSVGFPDLTIVRANTTLEKSCRKNNVLPSLAYGMKTCSLRFKKQPQDKFVNNWPPAVAAWARGQLIVKAIGFDAGCRDRKRAKPAAEFKGDANKYHNWFPLIDWSITREMCAEIIEAAGLPVPVKSACFFCPSMKRTEILELGVKTPKLLARALDMERAARPKLKGSVKGLGRSYAWETHVNEDRGQLQLWC